MNINFLIILIIFGLLILLFLLSCIKIFDENPTLKINERGVWHRSGYIPFSPLKLLEWNKIDFVELNIVSYSKHRKGKGLIIYKKNSLCISNFCFYSVFK